MIESIEFKNFKSLRDTTLPLGPYTILIGPNGSGKSTVLQALELLQEGTGKYSDLISFSLRSSPVATVEVALRSTDLPKDFRWGKRWEKDSGGSRFSEAPRGPSISEIARGHTPINNRTQIEQDSIQGIRIYSLDAGRIAQTASVTGAVELAKDGSNLAAVLDGLRDKAPENFKAIENQLGQWLPEFDCILFDCPQQGCKSIALRTKEGQYKVPATDLSQGTLVSLALLTLAYHPTRPSLIALEEPDRGMHPFLLRHVKDALIRLSNPDNFGEDREPVQVIATTHSPYFLDLFRETPEYVVVANKVGLDVQFQRLTDQPNASEIIGDAALGDAWFSGILGGVPSGS